MSRRGDGGQALVLGGEPRVDLLPVEIRDRAKSRATRRTLVLLVVLAVVVAGAGYAAASFLSLQATGRLEAEQARTQDLLAQQLEYAEVTEIQQQIVVISGAKILGTASEVLWDGVHEQLAGALPGGTAIEDASYDGFAPWEPAPTPAGPLRGTSVGTVKLTVTSPGVSEVTAWLRSVRDLPFVADATLDSSIDEEGAFTSTVTVNVDVSALANRFLPEAPAEEPDGDQAEQPTDQAGAGE